MYELFNALHDDDVVLVKQISCYLDDSKSVAPVSFPAGTAFKIRKDTNQWGSFLASSNNYWPIVSTDRGVLCCKRGDDDDHNAVEKILNASLVIKRDRNGKPVVRSKVKHGDNWQKAAPGAEVKCYVIGGANGERLRVAGRKNVWDNKKQGYTNVLTNDTEAKKHPDLGRAKQRCLYLCGYYNQFGQDMGMLYNYSIQVPKWDENWYIWSADVDGCIIDKVENCAQYVDRTQAYAALSKKYGADVKEVFKKIEKSSTPFYGVVVWSKFDATDVYNDDRFERLQNYDHDGQLIGDYAGFQIKKQLVDEVKKLVGKGEIRKFGKTALVVATPEVGDALQLRLTYTGRLDMRVIDLKTMQEA